MKKAIFKTAALAAFIPILLLGGCQRSPVLENDSALFKDYRKLERNLHLTKAFPNAPFENQYAEFLSEYGWDGDISHLKDGIYESYSVPDLQGYIHYVRFTIEDGSYTDVFYEEYLPEKTYGKSMDEEYDSGMTPLTGTTSAGTYRSLEHQLLEKQDPLNIDTVSGATWSSLRFQIVVLKAIYEAQSGTILNQQAYRGGNELHH